MKGAGGTSGGIGQFFIGLIMMCGGFYLLLRSITVSTHFGLGFRLYNFSLFGSSYGLTSGMIMITFMFGIGMIFFDSRNFIGWLLAVGSLTGLIFGVISAIHFRFQPMSAFDLITILVLAVGGLGLFLRSLKNLEKTLPE
ncbi:MAG: hypothetical protein JXR80_01320 [Deltaproteobacteria bacterium]|nr:hypothetical protein [Deltaproteobacteria bacterium]